MKILYLLILFTPICFASSSGRLDVVVYEKENWKDPQVKYYLVRDKKAEEIDLSLHPEVKSFSSGDHLELVKGHFLLMKNQINPKDYAHGNRSHAFILINFSDFKVTDIYSKQDVEKLVFTGENNYADYIKTASFGKLTVKEDHNGDGQYDIFVVNLDFPATGDIYKISNGALDELKKRDIDLNQWQHRVFLQGNIGSLFGVAHIGGWGSWMKMRDSIFLLAHELGHNYGFNHSNRPGISYNDTSCPMGAQYLTSYYNAPQGLAALWYESLPNYVQEIRESGEYTLRAHSDLSNEDSPAVLKILSKDGATVTTMSFRSRINEYENKLIHHDQEVVHVHQKEVTYFSPTNLMGALRESQKYVNPQEGFSVEVIDVGPRQARVQIEFGEPSDECDNVNPRYEMSPSTTILPGKRYHASGTFFVTNLNPEGCYSREFRLWSECDSCRVTLEKNSVLLAPGERKQVSFKIDQFQKEGENIFTIGTQSGFISGSAFVYDNKCYLAPKLQLETSKITLINKRSTKLRLKLTNSCPKDYRPIRFFVGTGDLGSKLLNSRAYPGSFELGSGETKDVNVYLSAKKSRMTSDFEVRSMIAKTKGTIDVFNPQGCEQNNILTTIETTEVDLKVLRKKRLSITMKSFNEQGCQLAMKLSRPKVKGLSLKLSPTKFKLFGGETKRLTLDLKRSKKTKKLPAKINFPLKIGNKSFLMTVKIK